MTQPNNSQRLWMYEQMLTSRYMEESIERIYMEGKTPVFNMAKGPIPGEMHLSNGQEPCAVGVCAHLEAGDIVTATHRPHHIAVAKGVDLNEMMAEIFGKATGLSGGRGGHMHLFDGRVNFSCSGIIAEGMGLAVGAALSRQMQGPAWPCPSSARCGQPGRLPRNAEPRRAVEAAGGVCHRGQRLGHLGGQGQRHLHQAAPRARRGLRNARCVRREQRPGRRVRAAGEAIERARAGGGPTSSRSRPTAWPATSWATAKPTAPRARRTA